METHYGDGNLISIVTPLLIIDGFWITSGTSTNGKSGDIHIEVDALEILNGGVINIGTSGSGAGGNLTVNASQSIRISGFRPSDTPLYFIVSGLHNRVDGDGNGGTIIVSSPSIVLEHWGGIFLLYS